MKVALITGAGGGIGRALAQRYAAAGYALVLSDRREEALRATGALAGGETLLHPCDITDAAAGEALIEAAIARFGRLDVLINNAGLTQVSPMRTTSLEVYRRVMDVNFFGALHTTLPALPHLCAVQGRIVVMSSIAGFAPLLARTGYCASKHALHGCFDTLRAELAPEGVSVTIVCPSFVETDFATRGLAGDGAVLGFERTTTGDTMTPAQVAEAVYVAAEARRPRAVLSRTGKLAWWVSRLAPGYYARTMARRFHADQARGGGA